MSTRLENIANACIVLLTVVVGSMLVNKYWHSRHDENVGNHAHGRKETLEIGEKIFPGNGTPGSLVFVLSTTCRYCTESAAFYQSLSTVATARGVRTVAVLPQTAEAARAYLSGLQLSFGQIEAGKSAVLAKIQGTPTLLLLDSEGRLLRSWRGRLPAEKEREVVAAVGELEWTSSAVAKCESCT